MKIDLPDANGRLTPFTLSGQPPPTRHEALPFNRRALAAVHVVADPFADAEPALGGRIDWEATMAYRCYVAGLGLGIAEAMDTAQRGMGLDWPAALELIGRTRSELPEAEVFNGCGTDQLSPEQARTLDDVLRAYEEQIDAVQRIGGRIILMASRALARLARRPHDYAAVYRHVLRGCDRPVILHWLGAMFDPALAGYWGASDIDAAMETCLVIIAENAAKIEGIKVSLLDKQREILMRRRLPAGVSMFTGDDFNYPELIAGDEEGHSDALLGIFDPLAPLAANALGALAGGDRERFKAILDPTVPLARHLFRPPTFHYKTGVVFLAWLNGFQDHFVMLAGAQSMRPLPYFAEVFRLADRCGLLRDPDLAIRRMNTLLALHGC
jgi:hypothetical protein